MSASPSRSSSSVSSNDPHFPARPNNVHHHANVTTSQLKTTLPSLPTMHTPGTSAGTLSPGGKHRHSQYYFFDGNVVFSVENTLYKVHRYFFQQHSSFFVSLFSDSTAVDGEGLSDDNPIALVDVTVKDFDPFLSILYPEDFRVRAAATAQEWGSILDLAAKWNFKTIELLAIEHLTEIDAPIDKIVLGRRHKVVPWLAECYETICKRPTPLTLEEGKLLGMEDVIKISTVRQSYGLSVSRYDQRLLAPNLPRIFGFDKLIPNGGSGGGELNSGAPADGVVNHEVHNRGDHVAFKTADASDPEAEVDTEAEHRPSSIEYSHDPGSHDNIKTTEGKGHTKSSTKMKKKKESQRKFEEQRLVREQELREEEERLREEDERQRQQMQQDMPRKRDPKRRTWRFGFL